MQAQLPEFGPFFASRKISDPFRIVGHRANLRASLPALQEFTLSLDSRVEFLTTERILVSLHQQLVAGISRRRSTFRSPPMHFNLDPTPTFSYSTLGFLFIHFFVLFSPTNLSLSLLSIASLFSPPSPSLSSFHLFTIPLPRSNVDLSNDYSRFNLSKLARGREKEKKKKGKRRKVSKDHRTQQSMTLSSSN